MKVTIFMVLKDSYYPVTGSNKKDLETAIKELSKSKQPITFTGIIGVIGNWHKYYRTKDDIERAMKRVAFIEKLRDLYRAGYTIEVET